MGFDLVVLAVDQSATDAEIRATADRCRSLHHPEGDLDERIVGFYETLRARYPDFSPHDQDSPWMTTPLDVGIDHVSMCLSFGERSDPALRLVDELAQRHKLTVYDSQDGKVTRPADVRKPLDPAILTLIDELRT
ncbi:hypothetical protein AB0M79_09370 [Polymorphospora sp. NPDC051019]|uniref:hypothetical protein n=1 Tax=Polymorphospora sp. NPDC051019 TaxID=3155725 RepID=UPI003424BDE2